MIKRVLVPLDGSELAERALVVAGDLAESVSATLILARVVPPPATGRFYQANLVKELKEAQTREAEAYLASAAQRLREDRLTAETLLLHGDVAPALVSAARHERCDLIAISSHGMSGLGSQVFGSVAQKLLYSAPCPVLVVPSTPGDLEREEEHEERAADEGLVGQIRAAQRHSEVSRG
jgi:nucleotide-binding universal stress UspA family protein